MYSACAVYVKAASFKCILPEDTEKVSKDLRGHVMVLYKYIREVNTWRLKSY